MNPGDRTVIVDGNCFWMEADSEGGYILGAPLKADRTPDMDALFELDPRAFVSTHSYHQFREAIRFLVTYQRG